MGFIGPIVGGIAEVVGQWLGNKKEEIKTKGEQKIEEIKGRNNWDQIQAENARDSWKDEWLTIIFTLPFVVMFISAAFGMQHVVDQMKYAFQTLENDVPAEYWYILGVIVSASFGIKKAGKMITKLKMNK